MDQNNMTMVPQLEPLFPATEHTDFRDLLNFADSHYGPDDAFIIKTGSLSTGTSLSVHSRTK